MSDVQPHGVPSRLDQVDERGCVTVRWTRFMAPWGSFKVVVDGVEVGRVRYRRPLSVDVPTGQHEVQLCGKRYASRVVTVDVVPGAHAKLEGETGHLPAGIARHRAISEWAKEYGISLSRENESPPTFEYVRPFNLGRLSVHLLAIALFALFAVNAAAHHRWVWVALTLVLITGSIALIRAELSRRHRST